jgi:hypothetical protein
MAAPRSSEAAVPAAPVPSNWPEPWAYPSGFTPGPDRFSQLPGLPGSHAGSHADERPCSSPDGCEQREATNPRSRTDMNERGCPHWIYGSEGWRFESLRTRPGQRRLTSSGRGTLCSRGAARGATRTRAGRRQRLDRRRQAVYRGGNGLGRLYLSLNPVRLAGLVTHRLSSVCVGEHLVSSGQVVVG